MRSFKPLFTATARGLGRRSLAFSLKAGGAGVEARAKLDTHKPPLKVRGIEKMANVWVVSQWMRAGSRISKRFQRKYGRPDDRAAQRRRKQLKAAAACVL